MNIKVKTIFSKLFSVSVVILLLFTSSYSLAKRWTVDSQLGGSCTLARAISAASANLHGHGCVPNDLNEPNKVVFIPSIGDFTYELSNSVTATDITIEGPGNLSSKSTMPKIVFKNFSSITVLGYLTVKNLRFDGQGNFNRAFTVSPYNTSLKRSSSLGIEGSEFFNFKYNLKPDLGSVIYAGESSSVNINNSWFHDNRARVGGLFSRIDIAL